MASFWGVGVVIHCKLKVMPALHYELRIRANYYIRAIQHSYPHGMISCYVKTFNSEDEQLIPYGEWML